MQYINPFSKARTTRLPKNIGVARNVVLLLLHIIISGPACFEEFTGERVTLANSSITWVRNQSSKKFLKRLKRTWARSSDTTLRNVDAGYRHFAILAPPVLPNKLQNREIGFKSRLEKGHCFWLIYSTNFGSNCAIIVPTSSMGSFCKRIMLVFSSYNVTGAPVSAFLWTFRLS